MSKAEKRICKWTSQGAALFEFATSTAPTQSADHIKPLHWYVACRLVLEGGFKPDEVTPRPPFRIEKGRSGSHLVFDAGVAGSGEQTVLGGLKTKNVDVVVTKPGLGPVVAVSCKGVTGAFRNLTNRLEETIGECTNLHITYPALVLGYLVLLRANRLKSAIAEPSTVEEVSKILSANDIALDDTGSPILSIVRFHNALVEMTGRQGIRDDISRYESIGFGLVKTRGECCGELVEDFPTPESKLNLRTFFKTLYERYDERFVLSAPDLRSRTARLEWAQISGLPESADYPLRLAFADN